MRATRTVAATVYPVSLSEAKAWLSLDDSVTGSDALITSFLIPDVVAYYESETSRLLLEQTWTFNLDASEVSSTIYLPYSPLASVSSIKVYDDNGTETTVSSSYYEVLTGEMAGIRLNESYDWPSYRSQSAMLITAKFGYGSTAAYVPTEIKLTIRSLIAYFYHNRGRGVLDSPAGGFHVVEIPRHIKDRVLRDRVGFWF